MISILDSLLTYVFFYLLPFCIYAGCAICLCMGLARLKDISKGYSHAQEAGLFLVISGCLLFYRAGYNHAALSCELEWTCWFIGLMAIVGASLVCAMAISFKVPTLIVAFFVWGFVLSNLGSAPDKPLIPVEESEMDSHSLIEEVETVDKYICFYHRN